MALGYDLTEPLDSRIIYHFTPKHHGLIKKASQWVIGYEEEYNLAEEIYIKIYKKQPKRYYWNVKRTNDELKVLGMQNSNKEYIGRFDLRNNIMHGYPIDHTVDSRQKPDNKALEILMKNHKITKKELKKISRGKVL